VIDEGDLAGAIALVHAADLRNGDMGLVDDAEHVLGEVVDERVGRLARGTAVKVTRVVLDAVAVAHALEHLEVVRRALREALRLEHVVGSLELGHTLLQLVADGREGARDLGTLRDVVRRGPDGHGIELADHLARDVVDLRDELDLIAEEPDAQRVLRIGRKDVDDIPPHAEHAALEVVVVAVVLDVDEVADEVVPLERDLLVHVGSKTRVVLWAADAVDARDGGHHDDVAPRQEARRRLVAELLDLLVDGGVLLDERVGLRDVGLGLVVVVVRDEVDDGVVGEEPLHLGCHLCGERLVRLHDERGTIELLYGLCHREGLSRARDPHERLVPQTITNALRELGDGLGLVPGRLVGRDDLERLSRILDPEPPELAAIALRWCRHGRGHVRHAPAPFSACHQSTAPSDELQTHVRYFATPCVLVTSMR